MSTIEAVHVIVNPASGQDEPVLNVLNTAFTAAGLGWDVSLTQQRGDAIAIAREQAARGVGIVAAYGGDDTIAEAAAGLAGSGVPLAILPGGTANVMAKELGLPLDLAAAAELIAGVHTIRPLDLGRVGDRIFLVRISTGVLADLVLDADREAKNRFGELAYALSGLRALAQPHDAQYRLTVDGVTAEIEGVACFVANAGSLGLPGLSLAPAICVDDGLLDAVVIRKVDLPSLISLAASAASLEAVGEPLPHWQGREIAVNVEPPHRAALDGEPLGETPLTASVLPGAIEVIVPAPAGKGA